MRQIVIFYCHSEAGSIYLAVYVDDIAIHGQWSLWHSSDKTVYFSQVCNIILITSTTYRPKTLVCSIASWDKLTIHEWRCNFSYKYVMEILEETGLLKVKPMALWWNLLSNFHQIRGSHFQIQTYKRVVEKLNHLMVSRKVISFVVSVVYNSQKYFSRWIRIGSYIIIWSLQMTANPILCSIK